MKKLFSVILSGVLIVIVYKANTQEPIPPPQIIKIKVKPKPIIFTASPLVDALIIVESGGKEDIIGDTHLVGNEAVGVLQIRPIMVREVNRLLKKHGFEPRFKLRDRFSREKSVEMFNVWVELAHSNDSDEVIARNWNGGPMGFKRKSTEKYWIKVQKQLSK